MGHQFFFYLFFFFFFLFFVGGDGDGLIDGHENADLFGEVSCRQGECIWSKGGGGRELITSVRAVME